MTLPNIVEMVSDDMSWIMHEFVDTMYTQYGQPLTDSKLAALFDPNETPNMTEWRDVWDEIMPFIDGMARAGIMCLYPHGHSKCHPTFNVLDCGLDFGVQNANPPGLQNYKGYSPLEAAHSYVLNEIGYKCLKFGKIWWDKKIYTERGYDQLTLSQGQTDPVEITNWLNGFDSGTPFFISITPKCPHPQTQRYSGLMTQEQWDLADRLANPAVQWRNELAYNRYCNDYLSACWQAIVDSGRDLSNTLVVYLTDNNYKSMRHGKGSTWGGTNNAMMLYNAAWAGTANEGRIIQRTTSIIDWSACVREHARQHLDDEILDGWPNQEGFNLVDTNIENQMNDWRILSYSSSNGSTGDNVKDAQYHDEKWSVYFNYGDGLNISSAYQRGWGDHFDIAEINNIRDTDPDFISFRPTIEERINEWVARKFEGSGLAGGIAVKWESTLGTYFLGGSGALQGVPVITDETPPDLAILGAPFNVQDNQFSLNYTLSEAANVTVSLNNGAITRTTAGIKGNNTFVVSGLSPGTSYTQNTAIAQDGAGNYSPNVPFSDVTTTGTPVVEVLSTFASTDTQLDRFSVGIPAGAAANDFTVMIVVCSDAVFPDTPAGFTPHYQNAFDGSSSLSVFTGPCSAVGWDLDHVNEVRWFVTVLTAGSWASTISTVGTNGIGSVLPVTHAGGTLATDGWLVGIAATRGNQWGVPASDYYPTWTNQPETPGTEVNICAHNTDQGNGASNSRGMAVVRSAGIITSGTGSGSLQWDTRNNNSWESMMISIEA